MLEELNQVGVRIRSAAAAPDSLSFELAKSFEWGRDTARAEISPVGGIVPPSTKAFLGAQPAAIFFATYDEPTPELVGNSALYAYHLTIPWGVVASPSGATLFNSHWIRDGEWLTLPQIAWDSLQPNQQVLEALSPTGIAERRLDALVAERHVPDRVLQQVDDALVARLDYWREETLRHSAETERIDSRLQTLFAQLFVLRIVEDRKLDHVLPPLSSFCAKIDRIDLNGLRQLMLNARQRVGGELFDDDVLSAIPTSVLGGLITDLYSPGHLPRRSARYNFAWLDADILGSAYEKYLSTVLVPLTLRSQLGLFAQPLRDVDRISVRRATGVYYTPTYLVKYLAESAIAALPEPVTPENIPRVADFSCGSGSFLVAVADILIKRLRECDPTKDWAKELVLGRHVIGIDNDEKAVTMARLNLWQRFAQEPEPLPLPRLSEIVVHGDALSDSVWAGVPEQYSAVVGNPPFLATGRTPTRDELGARFETAQGRYDYSYLFVELALQKLGPGGTLAMVVPNRLFRNRDASTIRELLTSHGDLLIVVDFGELEVFSGTSAYIGAVTARRRVPSAFPAPEVSVIKAKALTPQLQRALMAVALGAHGELKLDSAAVYVTPHPRGGSPWLLLSNEARRVRTDLEDRSEPLSNCAGIYQGIRTGANDIFIVNVESADGESVCRVVNGLGDAGLVERDILRPVVFGSEIHRYARMSPVQSLIYPYRNGAVIPEGTFRDQFPLAWAYLTRYRDLLGGRNSITASGLHWYELVRKRDSAWLFAPKLLIRDLATETSFAVDASGSIFLVGGTAVVPVDPAMLSALAGYLNSRTVNDYLSEITPLFKRGFQKFEPQHLAKIPVLRDLVEDEEFRQKLTGLAERVMAAVAEDRLDKQESCEKAIEELIRDRLGPLEG